MRTLCFQSPGKCVGSYILRPDLYLNENFGVIPYSSGDNTLNLLLKEPKAVSESDGVVV